MQSKKGFMFVETIVVTVVLLTSLMIIYALYVSVQTNETRRLRYDDPAKLYETYYIKKYLESFDMDLLKQAINSGSKYEIIYRTRSDIFGTYYREESKFFDKLWEQLHINNILFLSGNISSIVECREGLSSICSNRNLLSYLMTLDDNLGKFYLIVEYASSRSGGECTNTDCFYYYGSILIGD